MDSSVARTGAVTIFAAVLAVAGLSVVHTAQQLDKAGKIVMAAGNPQYVELATKYQTELRRYGVEMEIRSDTGGFATLRALTIETSLSDRIGRRTPTAALDASSPVAWLSARAP